MSALNNSALIGASGSTGYQISRSVRLRASASAYLNRTYGAPTNNKVWTWSAWIKRGSLSLADANHLFLASPQDVGSNPTSYSRLVFETDNTLRLQSANSAGEAFTSSAVYRDSSAWYHIVLYMDAANTTVKAYVNGVEISYASRTNPTNTNTVINGSGNYHRIGLFRSAEPRPFDGYITEVNFIDGQALTPSSFGETNPVTGVWQPKKYTGTYGTQGSYINFSDNSAATAAAIGKDYSGNGNNWTPNNISVTAGVTYDSMIDVPTQFADGGNGRGNYAVSNPLNAASGLTVSDGNLKIAASAGGSKFVNSSITFPSSGAYYAELTFANASTNLIGQTIGIALGSRSLTAAYNAVGSYHFYASNTGSLLSNGTETGGLSAISANEVFQVAVDVTNSKMWIGRSNVWYNSTGGTTGNPSTGANPTFTAAFANYFVFAGFDTGSAVSANINFGQRPFTYTPPTGFRALNTLNLPQPTILKGNQYMNVVTYTATPGTGNTISGVGFQTDLLWTKNRDNVEQHYWQDSVRGFSPSVGVTQMLSSNSSAAETSVAGITCTTTSDGFTVVDSAPGSGEFWFTNRTYVAWCWKANGTPAVTNTAGSITSTVSAGATQGFSVVTYTGTGSNATVGHGLGAAPSMIIIKSRTSVTDPSWIVAHVGVVMGTGRLILNTTDANSNAGASSLWNSTAATSSVFSLGTYSAVNQSSATFVAYCFAPVAGFSAFGGYTGNGSTDGAFIYLGFRPEFVMIKRTDTAESWNIVDAARNPTNQAGINLYPNLTNAESSNNLCDLVSNGFKLRNTWAGANASGGTYIYAAFAETPFKNALAR